MLPCCCKGFTQIITKILFRISYSPDGAWFFQIFSYVFSAKGASLFQPGATPQGVAFEIPSAEGAINGRRKTVHHRNDGAGFQP